MEPTPSSSKSKTPLFIGLGLLLVVALVGTAFLAGRFSNQLTAMARVSDDVMSSRIGVNPASELPKLPLLEKMPMMMFGPFGLDA